MLQIPFTNPGSPQPQPLSTPSPSCLLKLVEKLYMVYVSWCGHGSWSGHVSWLAHCSWFGYFLFSHHIWGRIVKPPVSTMRISLAAITDRFSNERAANINMNIKYIHIQLFQLKCRGRMYLRLHGSLFVVCNHSTMLAWFVLWICERSFVLLPCI